MDHHFSTRLITVGSADAFNHGGRANSAFWVQDHLGSYLLDCGPTTPLSLQNLSASETLSINKLDVIYLTHLHGDHIGGIPVLLLELTFGQQRSRPLLIAGPVNTEQRIRALCESTYPHMLETLINFPLLFKEWPLEGIGSYAQRTVQSIPARHDPYASPTSIKISSHQHSIVFSGDTGWNEELIKLSAKADILVLECSFKESVFAGHISLSEIEQHRSRITAKQLILTHFGNASRAAAVEKQSALLFEVAEDGILWTI